MWNRQSLPLQKWKTHCKLIAEAWVYPALGFVAYQLPSWVMNRSKQDLDKLSKLGHFLKGSSASIGLIAVSKSCAEMQNFGNCLDEAGSSRISSEKALENCTGLIVKLKKEQDAAKTWLEDFYKEKW